MIGILRIMGGFRDAYRDYYSAGAGDCRGGASVAAGNHFGTKSQGISGCAEAVRGNLAYRDR
jgi:hypothetical protein